MTGFDTGYLARRRRVRCVLAVVVTVVGAAGGCKKASTDGSAAVAPIDPDATVTAEQIVKAYRPCLATIQTTWEQRSSPLGRWRTFGREGAGVVVAGDGRSALVLTSRRLVDPRYRLEDPASRQNVLFRVFTPGETTTPGAGDYARLVAVYLNDADLALIRIGAPWPEPFAIPLADLQAPCVGDEVVVVGPPAVSGLVLGSGIINNYFQNHRLGTASMQIRLTDGQAATAGGVFARRGGRLVGVLRGQEQTRGGAGGDLFAESAQALRKIDFWNYLIDEGATRRLLEMID